MMITDTIPRTLRHGRLVLVPLGAILIGGLGALLVVIALQWRNPGVVGRWPGPQAAFVGLDLAMILAAAAGVRRGVVLAAAMAVLPVLAAIIAGVMAYRAAALRAVNAKCTLESADASLRITVRQVAITALAVGSES